MAASLTEAVSSFLIHVWPLLPHDQQHANDDHAPYGHDKLPFHGFRRYNVWPLLGGDRLRPDDAWQLTRDAQQLADDSLRLLA
jgi:hypothetical protein